MHPDYPELVKTALVSDVYWQQGKEPAQLNVLKDPFAIEPLLDKIQLLRDHQTASVIGSVLMSLEAGGTTEPVKWGEPLPIPHKRQVVKVVEDSREVISRFHPFYALEKVIIARTRARVAKDIKKLIPDFDFPSPTFEENLEHMYSSNLPFGPAAKIVSPYNRTHLALCKREVLYLKYDEGNSRFVALPSTYGSVPEVWEQVVLSEIPQTVVGKVYRKDVSGFGLGRIISADLVEADSVVWQDKVGPGTKKKRKRTSEDTLPEVAVLPVAS